MSNFWQLKFDDACRIYKIATRNTGGRTVDERSAAAETFLAYASEFESGNPGPNELLKTELQNDDVDRRNTAARLLVESRDSEALEVLLSYLENPTTRHFSRTAVRLIGRKTGLTPAQWDRLLNCIEQKSYYRSDIVEALLARPSSHAIALSQQYILANGVANHEVAKSLARWGAFDDLKQLIQESPDSHDTPPLADIRLEAAFQLGLHGEAVGITYLAENAKTADPQQAAYAALFLAYLGSSDAIDPIKTLLEGDDGNIVSFVLSAASVLGVAGIIEALLVVARKPVDFRAWDLTPPLADDALNRIANLVGKHLPLSEYDVDEIETLTDKARQSAIDYFDQYRHELIPSRRYFRGGKVSTGILIDNLFSPYSLVTKTAAYNLKSITGKGVVFDPDMDLIANLDALRFWMSQRDAGDILEETGWAYNGEVLPAPEW